MFAIVRFVVERQNPSLSTTVTLGKAVKFKHLISLLAISFSSLLRKRKSCWDTDPKGMAVSLERQSSG